jgi:hypothetical protein
VSRSRQLTPLPDDLSPAVRTLLAELRILKDRSGYDLRALASKTHASRSSWGRWLSGETWIPRDAVVSMAELCAADSTELIALWQQAEDERRARRLADAPAPRSSNASGTPFPASGTAVPPPNGSAVSSASGRPVPWANGTPVPPTHETAVPSASGSAVPSPNGFAGTVPQVSPAGEPRPRPRWGRTTFVGTVLGCALVGGLIGLVAGRSLHKPAATPTPHPHWLTRPEILSRVRTWHPHTGARIPYSQSGSYQGYRTDGSGYASMAIGLPAPGPNSGELASRGYTRRISAPELRPGDLIINPTGGSGTRQVAIFDGWADATHTRYWVYQQRRDYGTDHLVLAYPLNERSAYHPYRPLNIHETGTPATD